jgi:hypothetical protein
MRTASKGSPPKRLLALQKRIETTNTHTTMSGETYTIEITQDDFKEIEEALLTKIKRCRNNAKFCLSEGGMRKATSDDKSQEWEWKADNASNLITRIAHQMD